ncbi:C-terminal helicase domain-containing protein [Bradyrhizobium frederickii]|uniref:ATP-binding domain-containing protein n=1 Tax=Bradyrhizobium frederickii TaxID=2560054 RepID=UPI0014308473
MGQACPSPENCGADLVRAGDARLPAEDLVDLSLGYALTCHRAQGSEADYVIVALPPSRLFDPSWLYTAITRARQQVVIVGQPETIRDGAPAAVGRTSIAKWDSFGPYPC